MPSRLELQTLLEELLGSRNVYHQPPESKKMEYPAIVYVLDNIENTYADNRVFLSNKRYAVTVIDKNPDSPVMSKVAALPLCNFNRAYKADNLNHWAFTLYF